MKISTQELDVFFAFIGTRINTNATMPDNKQILWMALEVSKFMALKEKLDTLDIEFFYRVLSGGNLLLLSERTDTIGEFARTLLREFEDDTVSASLPIQIQEQMKEFFYQPKDEKFSAWHIGKAVHYALLGFFLTLSYYGFQHSWWLGLVVLIGIPSIITSGKLMGKMHFWHQKRIVQQTLRKEIQGKPNVYDMGLRYVDLMGVGSALQPHFYNLQKQIFIFSQIYPAKRQPENLYMEQDVLKMNNEHLPRLVKEYQNRPLAETEYKSVAKAIDTMTLVVQDHIADLVWENQHELNSTYRYWLNKVSGERFEAFKVKHYELSNQELKEMTLEQGRQDDA